jgi:hypothetical protein
MGTHILPIAYLTHDLSRLVAAYLLHTGHLSIARSVPVSTCILIIQIIIQKACYTPIDSLCTSYILFYPIYHPLLAAQTFPLHHLYKLLNYKIHFQNKKTRGMKMSTPIFT